MHQLRFNQVWWGLLGLATLSAFVISPAAGERVKGFTQNVFAPVARPVRVMGASVREHLVGAPQLDEGATPGHPRADQTVAAENRDLRLRVANLTAQVEALRQVARERELLGDANQFCSAVNVTGGDSGSREALLLQTTGADHIEVGMPVLFPGGIAGQISMAGAGGSRVRLITDPGFRVQGKFGRFLPDGGYIKFDNLLPLAEGVGRGQMVVRNLTARDVQTAGIQQGDWLVVADPDWPTALQGYKLGRVTDVTTQASSALMAEIHVRPAGDLMALREVMVMNRPPK